MKLLNIILIKVSILFTASCGCEGYGCELEFIQINTLKHTFSFRARTNANYNYSEERKCNQGNLRITYGNPTIDSISRGTLTLKRAYVYNSYFSQSLEFIVDSIKFSYP